MKTHKAIIMAFFAALIGLGGQQAKADGQRFGDVIDPKAPKVTLAEIVANPDAYAGKNVVVEGRFSGACGDGDFFFKDKFELIEVDPPKPEVCDLKKGTLVRLYGLVKVRRTDASEAGEKGEAGKKEAGEKGEATVRIVAKAVEVIK